LVVAVEQISHGFRYAFIETVMSIQLAPDVEAELRAEAAALGLSLNTLIANAVKAYLRDGSPDAPVRVCSGDRSAEIAWAYRPNAEFIGKWVVLRGNQVVASGSDPKELYEDVRAKGDSSPFLIFVSPDEQEPFAGGWID
jgi:hypothetical protein